MTRLRRRPQKRRRKDRTFLRPLIWVLAAVVLLAAAYLGIGLLVATRLTAADTGPMDRTPDAVGLDYREVRLQSTDGVRLSGWWVSRPASGARRAAILVHGWGGNKSNDQVLETARIYADEGFSVLMIDLRGHGESEAVRRTLGYKETRDVRGALDWLEERGFASEDVILHGWSMGAATVVRSAPEVRPDVAGVIEEAGYADLPLLLEDQLPERSPLPAFFNFGTFLSAKLFLGFDPWAVVPDESAARLSESGTPLFVIHSTTDEVVPFTHAGLMMTAYPEATFWPLSGYDHVTAYTHPEYRQRLLDFLDGVYGEQPADQAA